MFDVEVKYLGGGSKEIRCSASELTGAIRCLVHQRMSSNRRGLPCIRASGDDAVERERRLLERNRERVGEEERRRAYQVYIRISMYS